MMALLVKANGEVTTLAPKGRTFEFKGELYELLATDCIQLLQLFDGRYMLCDEEAKIRPGERKPVNPMATRLLWISGGMRDDEILGDVVICNRKELQNDDDEH